MTEELTEDAKLRRTRLLEALDIATSSWYRPPVPLEAQKRRGPAPQPIAAEIRQAVIEMATANPWYGYKIAVMCRRAGQAVKDRHAYAVMRPRACCSSHGRASRSCTRQRSCSSFAQNPTICGKWM